MEISRQRSINPNVTHKYAVTVTSIANVSRVTVEISRRLLSIRTGFERLIETSVHGASMTANGRAPATGGLLPSASMGQVRRQSTTSR